LPDYKHYFYFFLITRFPHESADNLTINGLFWPFFPASLLLTLDILSSKMKNTLDYSRPEIGAATRMWLMRCSVLQRLGHDEVDVLRSARPKGKIADENIHIP
jgi:hypothetical protein